MLNNIKKPTHGGCYYNNNIVRLIGCFNTIDSAIKNLYHGMPHISLCIPWNLFLWFNEFKHSTKDLVTGSKYLSKLIALKSVGINSGIGLYSGRTQ